MDTGILLLFIGLGGVIAGVFFGVGFFVRKIFAERLIRTAESKAREILVNAKREAEDTVKKADKEAKQYLFKIQSEFDTKVADERRRLENLEKVLSHKEGQIDQKVDLIEKREKEALYRLQEAVSKEKIVIDRERETEKLLQAQREALKKISNINAEEAKREFLKRLEIDMRADSSKIIREIEKEAHELADQKAKKILSLAIQRAAAAHTIESTVTAVALQ